jgi:hypothetical protein
VLTGTTSLLVGAASERRSIFPLGESGKVSTRTICCGTMYMGSRRERWILDLRVRREGRGRHPRAPRAADAPARKAGLGVSKCNSAAVATLFSSVRPATCQGKKSHNECELTHRMCPPHMKYLGHE